MRATRTGQQRITVDELGGNDAIVVTISEARVQSFSNNYLSGGDEKVVLKFEEFGDADYVLNATSYRTLTVRYGDGRATGFRAWLRQPCVLVKAETEDPRTGNPMLAVWVARPDQWAEAMRAIAPEPAPKPATKPAATTATGKRIGRPPGTRANGRKGGGK